MSIEKSKTFCMYPFTHLNLKTDGSVAPCFRSKPVSSLSDFDLTTIWNEKGMRELRKAKMKGERSPICNSCWHLEDSGVTSYRQKSLYNVSPFNQWHGVLDEYDSKTGEMRTSPKQVELRFSRLCNFRCRMCNPLYSTKWKEQYQKTPHIEKFLTERSCGAIRARQTFPLYEDGDFHPMILDFLEKNKSSLEHVMIAGGEPLINEAHYKALEILKPFGKNITLEYSTNLSTLKFKGVDLIHEWSHFKNVIVKISIDGDPLVYEYVRTGANLEVLEKNIRAIHEASDRAKIRILGTCTTSIYNVARLPQMAKFFTDLGLLFHTSQVVEPYFLRSQVLPLEIKKKITREVEAFLSKISIEDADFFSGHPIWGPKTMKENQVDRFKLHLRDCLNYMNASDRFAEFADFLTYEQILNEASVKLRERNPDRIFEFYPEWKEFVV